MRGAKDHFNNGTDVTHALGNLDWWRQRLEEMYSRRQHGHPEHPARVLEELFMSWVLSFCEKCRSFACWSCWTRSSNSWRQGIANIIFSKVLGIPSLVASCFNSN